MNIKEQLKAIAEALILPDETQPVFPSVFYGNDFEANARIDNVAYPLCQVVQILASGADINPRNGKAKNRWNVFVFFCDKQPGGLEATAEDNDLIIDRMRAAALQYAADIYQTGDFELITRIEFKHLFFKFDSTVTGVLAYFTVNEKNGTGNFC